MKYEILTEALHPDTGKLYKVGDNVLVYQGRFGHNNIITINSMFTTNYKRDKNMIYVSDKFYSKLDYKKSFPSNPTGTYLNEVKRKISSKELKEIQKARRIVSIYGQ